MERLKTKGLQYVYPGALAAGTLLLHYYMSTLPVLIRLVSLLFFRVVSRFYTYLATFSVKKKKLTQLRHEIKETSEFTVQKTVTLYTE